MTDKGTFSVQSQTLRGEATLWSDHAGDMDTAHADISPSIGASDDLGALARLNGVGDLFDQWTIAMAQALTDAARTFRYLDAALTSTANDYDGVDSTVATDMNTLDAMNNLPG